MKRVKIALLGAGRMGRNHARVFSTLRYADLVGIHDPNAAVGTALAHQHEVEYFSDVNALLDKVDAVSIVTPTPWHHELALACLERGLDVFVEKPFTTTVAEAVDVAAAVEKSGCILQVGHIERFNPAYRELKAVLEGMTPLVVNFNRLSTYVGSNTDVDVVLDLMVHDIDLALDLAGEMPIDVIAHGMTALSGSIDYASVILKFRNLPMVTLTASRITEQKVRAINVTALEAYLEADLMNKSVSAHYRTVGEYVSGTHTGGKYRQESVVERIQVPIAEPLYHELEHFLLCVRNRNVPLVTAEHGLANLRLSEEIRRHILNNMTDVRSRAGSVMPLGVKVLANAA